MPKAVFAPVLGDGGSKKVDLDQDVFAAPFNGPLVHEVVVAELAARRQGTHATRTRGMVAGGGAKPCRRGRGRCPSGATAWRRRRGRCRASSSPRCPAGAR